MDLFDLTTKQNEPLASRMRPKVIEEFIGQKHILYKNSLLERAIRAGCLGNCIFYGPPGTGKTTLANIISNTEHANFIRLNAVTNGVADAKNAIESARKNFKMYGTKTYLLLDECHRWSKSQSDSILEALEDGSVTFIGSTTENPFFSMTRAIVSRCRVFEFKPLTISDLKSVINRALNDKVNGFGNLKIDITIDAVNHIASASGGDVRNCLNALELAVLSTSPNKEGIIKIDLYVAEESIQQKAMSIDDSAYYDLLSAFCKSIRGSDCEAALYYANRLMEAGCDPLVIARRLIAHCSEDIGMADSNAALLAFIALQAIKEIGMPEANIPLTHAIIYACEAPKSNSVIMAMNMAINDAIKYPNEPIPSYLKNNSNLQSEHPELYKYPHKFGGYVKQQYMPNVLKDREYYTPSNNGREKGYIRKKIK